MSLAPLFPVTQCPVCQHTLLSKFSSAKDHTVSGEVFDIVQCASCTHLTTSPRPGPDEIGPYYQSEDYISHTNEKKGLLASLYQRARKRALNRKLKIIGKHVAYKQALLDVGCGTGEFLGAAKAKGWAVHGIEPSPQAAQLARDNHKVPVDGEAALDTLAKNAYHAITMWHVLEHVDGLHERLVQLQRLIHPEGRLFIAVPNPESWDADHFGSFWAAWDVPRHLHHFRPAVLRALLAKYGFLHEETLPMPMDAYYISLLSAKYKTGKDIGLGSFISAFFMGRKSNAHAKKHGDTWSSQLYIFKPQTDYTGKLPGKA